MISIELALAKTIIDIFAMEDAYDESPALNRLLRVADSLDNDQGYYFGSAYARALQTLGADLPRWRQATDIAARFDLYEVAETLANQVLKEPDAHQIATLAYLVQNPAVPPDVVNQFTAVTSLIPLNESLSRMMAIRTSPDVRPETDLERAVATQAWPGLHPRADLVRFAPTIYLAEQAATSVDILKVSSVLIDCGARVRRIPESWNRNVPPSWLSDIWPVVAWTGSASAWLRSNLPNFHPTPVIVKENLSASYAMARLVARIDSRLPQPAKLKRRETLSGIHLRAFAPETLRLGAFDAAEMSYLGAASRSVVQRVSKQSLTPWDADVYRWRFDQLVALRIFQAFKASGKSFKESPAVIQQRLSEISMASEQHRVAIDSSGEFYVEENDVFRSTNGQAALGDVLTMDDVFRPIVIGGGSYPDLLNPSRFTSVHPGVLSGTPAVSQHRVSARAVSEVYETQGQNVARSAYPELSVFEIQDARAVGAGINAARQ